MKKLSINLPILPDGITHVNTIWNIYDAIGTLVKTETNNPKTILAYELDLPIYEENYYIAEAILELSDGSTVETTRVKIVKDTRLITDTVALPPKINFSIVKDGKYKLTIGEPTLIGGVDDWDSTDWLVTTSAGVVLYRLDNSKAHKEFVVIPDSVLSSHDFVIFKARYNLRQNTESKYGAFGYVRNSSATDFTLDNTRLLVGQTNVYMLFDTKPKEYIFYYEVLLNGYRVSKGYVTPESGITIPVEHTLGLDNAKIIIMDKNIQGEYKKEFDLKIVDDIGSLNGIVFWKSGKQELTHSIIDTSAVLGSTSGQIAVSPILRNVQSLQVQGGNRVYDNTFRCTYYNLISQTLSVIKVGSTVEKLSNNLHTVEDAMFDFSTHHIKGNRVVLFYRGADETTGKLKMYDMQDNKATLIAELESPTNFRTNVTTLNGFVYWTNGDEIMRWDGINAPIATAIIGGYTVGDIMIPSTDAFYFFSLDGTVKKQTDVVIDLEFLPDGVDELKVTNISDEIVITYRVEDKITFGRFTDEQTYVFETIKDTTIEKHILLLDHYNKHIHIVKG